MKYSSIIVTQLHVSSKSIWVETKSHNIIIRSFKISKIKFHGKIEKQLTSLWNILLNKYDIISLRLKENYLLLNIGRIFEKAEKKNSNFIDISFLRNYLPKNLDIENTSGYEIPLISIKDENSSLSKYIVFEHLDLSGNSSKFLTGFLEIREITPIIGTIQYKSDNKNSLVLEVEKNFEQSKNNLMQFLGNFQGCEGSIRILNKRDIKKTQGLLKLGISTFDINPEIIRMIIAVIPQVMNTVNIREPITAFKFIDQIEPRITNGKPKKKISKVDPFKSLVYQISNKYGWNVKEEEKLTKGQYLYNIVFEEIELRIFTIVNFNSIPKILKSSNSLKSLPIVIHKENLPNKWKDIPADFVKIDELEEIMGLELFI